MDWSMRIVFAAGTTAAVAWKAQESGIISDVAFIVAFPTFAVLAAAALLYSAFLKKP